jgi:hypothetical protein
MKALQSVGQIIGEILKQLDDERCERRRHGVLAKPRTLRLPNLEPSFAKPQSECQSEREHLRLIAGSEFKSDG